MQQLIASFLLSIIGVMSYFSIVKPFQVIGSSMSPNYNDGMYLMTKVVHPKNDIVKRGDVVVFKLPKNQDVNSIERIVGLPGETILLKSGSVYINGKKLDESTYLSSSIQTYGGKFISEEKPINIPSDQYVTFGDNRTHSSDSREWGLVPKENIIGKVSLCYWNCKNRNCGLYNYWSNLVFCL